MSQFFLGLPELASQAFDLVLQLRLAFRASFAENGPATPFSYRLDLDEKVQRS